MTKTVLLTLVLCLLAGSALAEVCLSPYVKRLQGPEKVLYVWSVAADPAGQDGLAVVDVALPSSTYGQLINFVPVGPAGNEPHHMGFTDDRTKLWAGTLFSNRIFIFDLADDPAHPRLLRTLDNLGELTGLFGPHTYYALPGRMLITFLSAADGGLPGGIAEFTSSGDLIRVFKNPPEAPYQYDAAVKPDVNRLVTSSFTPYRNYRKPLAQWDMKDGGNTLLVWDFKNRKILQTLTTDPVPLEVRWSLKPGHAYGWINSALGDSIWWFGQGADGRFSTRKAADLGKGCLPADLRQSPDDHYLYVSCFMTSQVQAWDVSDPVKARLHDVLVPGVQPNMLHVTGDGKRIYITNSLLSTMDYSQNFWVRLAHVGPDGRLKLDPFFNVDFTKLPGGPHRAHDMLLN
jgi:selenium-binding protein 1